MIKVFFVAVVMLSLLLAGCSSSSVNPEFAQCLTEKGAVMYGAYWCSHCINQKKLFGDSWEFVNYVECSLPGGKGQTEVCVKAGIEGYPTWEFADGSRQSGELSLAALSTTTGCPLS